MKNPDEKSNFGKLKNYNAKSPVWGFAKFCKKDRLPKDGEITIGVRFNKVQFESERIPTPLPSQQIPQDLVKAWKAELNQPEISDVQFNFTNCERASCQTLYARSSILSERSIYFNSMLQQDRWSESMKDSKNKSAGGLMEKFKTEIYRKFKSRTPESQAYYCNTIQPQKISKSTDSTKLKHDNSTIPPSACEKLSLSNTKKNINKATLNDDCLEVSSARNPSIPKKYTVTISDFHPDTFKSMLRFLYTDHIDFYPLSSHRRPLDIFKIADKYLITELRDRAKTKIFKDLTPKSAIEMLFDENIWLWDDLKEESEDDEDIAIRRELFRELLERVRKDVCAVQ
ncbi:3107_t:CDS:2 [Acaulospora colombiana]|uniref:3107_t:CDS:1 n=1 Tax=Acaulospora colombiana TaxID=27376 RepID=A0ACA9L1I4_9GLOM|nr:3107_t:CDS:2 [Acaulospora colombiana]